MKPNSVQTRIIWKLVFGVLLFIYSAETGRAASPRLVEPRRGTDGVFRLKLQDAGAGRFTLEASPDFVTWIPLSVREAANGGADFADDRSAEFQRMFYRTTVAATDGAINPLNVLIQLDEGRTTSVLVSPEGGALALTNSAGAVIELKIPEGSVETDTEIRLTWVKQITNWPFSGALLAAAQIEPEGLVLKKPASLSFRLASTPAMAEVVAFGYRGLGDGFHLVPDETDRNVVTLRITHFSGAGVGLGGNDEMAGLNARVPALELDRFEATLAFLRLTIRRQGGIPASAQLDALEQLHRQFYLATLGPALKAAVVKPELFGDASGAFLLWTIWVNQAGLTARLQDLIDAGQLLLDQAGLTARETQSAWRRLDVNHDNRVDAEDGKIIFANGMWKPTVDIDGDGKSGISDFWAWILFISHWDRDGDLAVSSEDFRAISPVALPAANAALRDGMVRAALTPLPSTLPLNFEATLLALQTNTIPADDHLKSRVLASGGLSALAQHNLEVARWAFARAFQMDATNSAALANLAFTLAADGHDSEALQLIANALLLEPECAAAWNNLGAIYAHHGQFAEAVKSYDRAILYAPSVGQYLLNKAVCQLQSGAVSAASVSALAATRLSAQDSEAQLFSLAIHPPNPGALQALEAQYEQFRQEEIANNSNPPPWSQMTFSEKASAILDLPDYQNSKKLDARLGTLLDQTMDQARQEFESIRPKFVSAGQDLTAFLNHFPSTAEKLLHVSETANIQALDEARALGRQAAGEKLCMDQIVLQLALAQGQSDMLLYSDPNEARLAFESAVEQIYEDPMRSAADHLRHPLWSGSINLPTEFIDMLQWASGLGFVAILTGGVADANGYGKDFTAPAKQIDPFDTSKFGASPLVGISLGGGMLQADYNLATEEQKIQVGQGVIVVATWSPKSGYGFQIGVGVSFALGPARAVAGTYAKFGSDGSLSVVTKVIAAGAAGPIGGKVADSFETSIYAGTHAPIMSVRSIFGP